LLDHDGTIPELGQRDDVGAAGEPVVGVLESDLVLSVRARREQSPVEVEQLDDPVLGRETDLAGGGCLLWQHLSLGERHHPVGQLARARPRVVARVGGDVHGRVPRVAVRVVEVAATP
jgi:hypothetical protein